MGKSKAAQSLDAHLSAQMKAFRVLRGLARADVDKALGLAAGTVSRLERGERRLDAPLAIRLAHLFDIGIEAFFTGAPPPGVVCDRAVEAGVSVEEVTGLVRAFRKIENKDVRRELLKLIGSVAESPDEESDSAVGRQKKAG